MWSTPRALALRALARLTRRFHPPGTKRVVRALHDPSDRPWSVSGTVSLRDGLHFHVDTASWIEWNLFFWGAYDARLRGFLEQSLTPGATAIDVGANVGVHTLAMARTVGEGRVVACEPSPTVVRRLRANVALNELANVTIEEVAVGDEPGHVTLTLPAPEESNQGTARVTIDPPSPESVTVSAVTVDGVVESAALDRVDLIKIDVEGLDAAVLRGASATLARWRPLLVFEYDSHSWGEAGYELASTLSLLREAGYRHFAALAPGGLVPFGSNPPAGKNIVASAEPLTQGGGG